MKFILGLLVLIAVFAVGYLKFNQGLTVNTVTSILLDQSSKGISQITSSIYSNTDTTDLILSNNSIRSLPSQIGNMSKVVIFKMDHNLLEGSLAAEIRQMSQLKVLDASYNNMTGIPAEIGQLTKLQTLNLSNNNISSLPNELSNLKNNLKTFNLSGNPLTQSQINNLKATLPKTKIIF